MTQVKIQNKIISMQLPKVIDYGYKDELEFIKDAVRARILDLKKIEFGKLVNKVKNKMIEQKITEKDILKDFNEFSKK